jgi:DNA-binding winged helix-turn-helix (wHTH) protein
MVLSATHFRFGEFRLDVAGRRLWRGHEPVELSGRYFDALVLLLREPGQLIAKDRFFEEVWAGVIVSDSALTQCIKEIRKQLGDDATDPRYVQTVPRYGYRFVAPVTIEAPHAPTAVTDLQPSEAPTPVPPNKLERAIRDGLAGTFGGGVAGLFGGLLYGLVLAHGSTSGMGTASTLAVFLSLGLFLGMAGGFGVSAGLALAALFRPAHKAWAIAGATVGGMVVGAVADLLGLDAFNLLFGRSLAGITGAPEGALLGAALALGGMLGGGAEAPRSWRPVLGAGVLAGAAGVLIPLAGGQLFAGSLNNLAAAFADSRLQVHALGGLFGDTQFGTTTQAMLGGLEALLFAVCVVGGRVLVAGARARAALLG